MTILVVFKLVFLAVFEQFFTDSCLNDDLNYV